MNLPRFRWLGSGVALPERRLDNLRLAAELGIDADSIEARTGIRERRIADPEQTVTSLGAEAAVAALSQAGVDPLDVDLVLLSTYTPDRLLCPTSPEIAHAIGASRAAAFDLNAACSGGVVGLIQAAALVSSGLYRKVLLVCSDLTTRYIRSDDEKTRLLFGDGAAAILVGAPEGDRVWEIVAIEGGSDGSGAALFNVPAGAARQRVGAMAGVGHATESTARSETIEMNGRAIFRFGVERGAQLIDRLVHASGIPREQIGCVVPHQANLRIIQALIERSGIAAERWACNIDRYGNTASASVPIALIEELEGSRLASGDAALLIAFGAGLTWAGAVIRRTF